VNARHGWLLHRRPFRDSSALVDLLLPGRGLVRAVARGIHSGRSRLAQVLQPFSPIHASCSGRGQLDTLTHAESAAPPLLLAGDALICAFYLNELLVRLLPQDEECDPILAAYGQTLQALHQGEQQLAAVLRPFEALLLAHLGYELDWQHDGHEQPLLADGRYHFTASDGWVPSGPPAQTAWSQSPRQVKGATLLQMNQPQQQDEWRQAARSVLRLMLDELLGDKPLQSRALMRQQRLRSTM
jgi:DNA repair protein RecO (recombination protein O)